MDDGEFPRNKVIFYTALAKKEIVEVPLQTPIEP